MQKTQLTIEKHSCLVAAEKLAMTEGINAKSQKVIEFLTNRAKELEGKILALEVEKK